MQKQRYCVVYLTPGGMHQRFRVTAQNKRDARKACRDIMGITDKMIVEVLVED